jgi:hypothetical protein
LLIFTVINFFFYKYEWQQIWIAYGAYRFLNWILVRVLWNIDEELCCQKSIQLVRVPVSRNPESWNMKSTVGSGFLREQNPKEQKPWHYYRLYYLKVNITYADIILGLLNSLHCGNEQLEQCDQCKLIVKYKKLSCIEKDN